MTPAEAITLAVVLAALLLVGCGHADTPDQPPVVVPRPVIRVIPEPVCIDKHGAVPCPQETPR